MDTTGTQTKEPIVNGPIQVSLSSKGDSLYDLWFNRDSTLRPLLVHKDFEQVALKMLFNPSNSDLLGLSTRGPNVFITNEDPNFSEKLNSFLVIASRLEQNTFSIKVNKKTPESFSLRKYVPSVYDQGTMGCCFANSLSQLINVCRAYSWEQMFPSLSLKEILDNVWEKRPSRTFIQYNCDRIQTEIFGNTVFEQGAMDWSALQSIKEFGAPSETIYDYPIINIVSRKKFKTLNPKVQNELLLELYQKIVHPADSYVYAKAKYEHDMNNLSWMSITNPKLSVNKNDLEKFDIAKTKIKELISNGFALYAGIPVYDSWICLPKHDNEIVPLPSEEDNQQGFHAICLVGYDKDYVEFVNSWGSSTGNSGFFKLPWKYLESDKCSVSLLVSWDWKQSSILK